MNEFTFNSQICGHRASLMQSAVKFTGNSDDADDLVQDTLIKAIRYETMYKEGTNLRGWLFTIMKNTFINNYRSLLKKKSVLVTNNDLLAYPLPAYASRNKGEARFTMEDINKAIHNLLPAYSIPFLRYFEGYKYHEIANELDIPVGTVKTRIHIARKLLKADLKMYKDDFARLKTQA
jgi:RNA polymerase sigma factor (sigma-70 family)